MKHQDYSLLSDRILVVFPISRIFYSKHTHPIAEVILWHPIYPRQSGTNLKLCPLIWKNCILERNVQLESLPDLIKVLEDIVAESEGRSKGLNTKKDSPLSKNEKGIPFLFYSCG